MLANVSRSLLSAPLLRGALGSCTRMASAVADAAPASSTESSVPFGVGTSFKVTRKFTPEDVGTFMKLTGDTNPIHVTEEAAASRGLPGPVLPGIMMASLFPGLVGSTFPGSLYMTQSLTFRTPAPVNSVLTATVTVTKVSGSKLRFETTCHTAGGALVLDGMAVCVLPKATDSQILYRPDGTDESFWGNRCSLSDV